jgi:peptidylprolyl isomerase
MTSTTRVLGGVAPLLAAALISSAATAQAPAVPHPAASKAAPAAAPRPAAPAPKPQAAAAPPAAIPADSTVVAHLGSQDVTADQVKAFVATLDPREQAAVVRDPALLAQAVRMMLANQLALKEALEKKLDQQPAVAAQLDRVRNSAVTEIYLQSVSMPPAGFPDEADVAKVYEASQAAFLVPRQFQIAQIYVALPADADKAKEDAAKKKLADVEAKLKQPGADFAAIAASDSDDHEAASHGGEIGWVMENQVRPEIKVQVLGMAKGAVSEAIKMDDGWHVVKLLDTKASYTRPLSEVHELVVQRLRAQRADANRRAYLAKLLEQSPPAINEIALSKIFSDASEAVGR